MTEKKYSREDYIFLAKLYERADRLEDMITLVKEYINLDPNLSIEERNIFSSAYKNNITPKRVSWRLLHSMEKKEQKKNTPNLPYIKLTKENVAKEITEICNEIQNLLDNQLLANCNEEDAESKVFYLKCKGDYYRYLAEIAFEEEFEKACFNADNSYKLAYEISERELPIYNPIRLGLALNFSVFNYEVLSKHEDGCIIAKLAFEEAVKVIDDLDKGKVKDAILIVQILKENLILWTSEINDDEIE
jgi:14-3-3 protein epsilon